MSIQCWLVWSICCPRGSQESSLAPDFESITSVLNLLYGQTLTSIHDYWKNYSFDRVTFFSKVMSLLFNSFSSKEQVSFNFMVRSPSTVILEPKKMKSITVSGCFCFCFCFCFFPSFSLFALKWWDQIPWSWFFKCWVLSQFFHSPLSPSYRGFLVHLCFLPWGRCHLNACVYAHSLLSCLNLCDPHGL